MPDVNQHLIKLADHLDSLGKKECANIIDQLIKSASLSKVSQYVGAIGYVLKQNRAMGNCIRKKRVASNSSMQEVVLECLKEYQDGQSYGTNDWTTKYAQVIKKEPALFGDAHLYFLSALGYESGIPGHIKEVQQADEALRKEGIEDAVLSRILSHVDTLGNILQKESNSSFPFKVAAPPTRSRWSRFFNPTETSGNPLSWFGGTQRGQNLDTKALMKELLGNIMSISTTGRKMQTSINQLKSRGGYLEGRGGPARGPIAPIKRALDALDPANWAASIRALRVLQNSLRGKVSPDAYIQENIITPLLSLSQEIQGNVQNIYTNLEAAQDTMQTLRQQEPILGRGYGYGDQGTATAKIFGTLQEILGHMSSNPLNTDLHNFAQQTIGQLNDILQMRSSEAYPGQTEELAGQLGPMQQPVEPTTAPEEVAQVPQEAPQAAPQEVALQETPSTEPEATMEEVQDLVEAVRNSGVDPRQAAHLLQQVLGTGEFAQNRIPQQTRLMLNYLVDVLTENPNQPQAGGGAPSVGGPAITGASFSTVVKLADAFDEVDQKVADVLDGYLEEYKSSDIFVMPNFSTVLKEEGN